MMGMDLIGKNPKNSFGYSFSTNWNGWRALMVACEDVAPHLTSKLADSTEADSLDSCPTVSEQDAAELGMLLMKEIESVRVAVIHAIPETVPDAKSLLYFNCEMHDFALFLLSCGGCLLT